MKKVTVLTSLYRCAKYLNCYFEHVRNLSDRENIEILLLHNDPTKEEICVIEKNLQDLPFVRHIIIPEREGLYATWNRGVLLSETEYVCVWNVDDIRFPDSVRRQAEALDTHPEALLTYGDFYYMFEYPVISDSLVVNKDFSINPSCFFRSHQIGCFPMWRRKLHDTLGYFDEQFKLVADLDFQIRIARTAKIVKTNAVIGAYLENVPDKLSSNTKVQLNERNFLNWRYGVFDLLNWLVFLCDKREINPYSISFNKKTMPIRSLFRNYIFFVTLRFPLIFLSLVRQPRYIASFFKHRIFFRLWH